MKQYIDKSAIVAEIKRRIALFQKEKKTEKGSAEASQMNVVSLGARIAMLEEILSFFDTLEVKELKKVDRTKDLSNYIKFLKSFHCWNKIQREIMDKYLEEQIKKNYSSKEDEKVDNERKPLYGRGDIIEYRGCPYFIEEVVTPKENIFYYNAVSLCFGETSRRISIGAEGEKDIILISNNRFDYEKADIQQKDFAPKASTANRQVYNRAILTILSDYVEKYPDIRFGQMLCNLDIKPHFDEESREAYWNLCKTINKQNHE